MQQLYTVQKHNCLSHGGDRAVCNVSLISTNDFSIKARLTIAVNGTPAATPLAVAGTEAGAGPPPALAIASSASSTVTNLGDSLSDHSTLLYAWLQHPAERGQSQMWLLSAWCWLKKKKLVSWDAEVRYTHMQKWLTRFQKLLRCSKLPMSLSQCPAA